MLGIPMHGVYCLLEGETYKEKQRVRGENLVVDWAGGRSRTIDRAVRKIKEKI